MNLLRPAVLALLTLAAAPALADLDARERRIVAAVGPRIPAALELLQRTVNVNSGTMNLEGVREVGRMFAPAYAALGFRTEWVDGAAWQRAGHLVARRPGRRGAPHVLLIGHLDTVFERDSPFQRFERLDDSTARGPGTCDMKGGNVVMLAALGALRDAGVLDRLSCTVVLTGDEEKSGRPHERSRRDLIAAADAADVAIGFEDGDGDPRTAVVARRGATSWILRVRGQPAHSSQVFQPGVGAGAIYEAARILEAFRVDLAAESLLTFNPGAIVGGTTIDYEPERNRGSAFGKTNVVAESTVVHGDLRALSPEQLERVQRRMEGIVARSLDGTRAAIRFEDGYPPLAPRPGNLRLLAMFDQASRDLGHGPVTAVNPRNAGAADISFCDQRVEMALDGVGLMGTGGHTVEETADLRTLPMNARRVALTLWRLAAGWGRGRRGP